MPKFIDLTGHKYGKFIVLCKDVKRSKPGKIYWVCECECGRDKSIRGANLRNGNSSSCGICIALRSSSKNWTGYGELPGVLWRDLQHGARRRNIEFSISIEFAWNLYETQSRKCNLSGRDIYFGNRANKGTASLDRIDNSKGYTENNVQWIHKMINRVKMDYSQHDFIEMCKEVTKFNEY